MTGYLVTIANSIAFDTGRYVYIYLKPGFNPVCVTVTHVQRDEKSKSTQNR